MTLYLLEVYAHLVSGVLLIGYALFWVVMAIGVGREGDSRLLAVINGSRWPPAGLPRGLRLPLPWLGWAFLLALAVTGLLLLHIRGLTPDALFSAEALAGRFGRLMAVKLMLFGLLVLGHAAATFRPRRWLAFTNGGLALVIVLVSVLIRR
ncbi:MAG TPA: hypothetical protein VM737_05670 [Gemmatimonadota bacterium]|nr:hypothetical protein [Gemmatimonadota bacterium]